MKIALSNTHGCIALLAENYLLMNEKEHLLKKFGSSFNLRELFVELTSNFEKKYGDIHILEMNGNYVNYNTEQLLTFDVFEKSIKLLFFYNELTA